MLGWIKFNFDKATKGNLSLSRCEAILRYGEGKQLKVTMVPLGIQTNHLAKAMGLLQRLKLVRSLKEKRVWKEGYWHNILNFLSNSLDPSWLINIFMKKSKSVIIKFDNVYISLI